MKLEELYDWAGRACHLMCDPTEPLHQKLMSDLVVEWDRHHATEIKAMGEAWAAGLCETNREALKLRQGEKNSKAKLSDLQAALLLALKGTMFQREAAALFGISQSNVSYIWSGKSRKHLQGDI